MLTIMQKRAAIAKIYNAIAYNHLVNIKNLPQKKRAEALMMYFVLKELASLASKRSS